MCTSVFMEAGCASRIFFARILWRNLIIFKRQKKKVFIWWFLQNKHIFLAAFPTDFAYTALGICAENRSALYNYLGEYLYHLCINSSACNQLFLPAENRGFRSRYFSQYSKNQYLDTDASVNSTEYIQANTTIKHMYLYS